MGSLHLFYNELFGFQRDMKVAFEDGFHSDIEIKPSNGPSIRAHKVILATRSKLLRDMLQLEEHVYAPNGTMSLSLPEFNHEQLKFFLEFLYTGYLASQTVQNNAYALMTAADKYEIPFLHKFCSWAMIKSMNTSNALEVLELSDKCSNQLLKEAAIKYIVEHRKAIVFSAGFEEYAKQNPHLIVKITRAIIVKETNNKKSQELFGFQRDMKVAFEDGFHSDIEIKPSNGPSIRAHKVILATRSKLLRDMLQLEEHVYAPNGTMSLSLPEFNHEQLKCFLEFLYTGYLAPQTVQNNAYALMRAADKYEIPFLRKFCSWAMVKSMNTSNALEVLELSDHCSDMLLKEAVIRYIVEHKQAIVFSTGYDEYNKKNPHLSVEITRAILNETNNKNLR